MIITPIYTRKIVPNIDIDIFDVLNKALPKLKERSIVAVTSKIVAICEGRIKDPALIDKTDLAIEEAEYYLPRTSTKYNVLPTIKYGVFAFTAGIDESNGNGMYILLPKNPQTSANNIRKFLRNRNKIKELGVIITDTVSAPLRRGQRGTMIGYSGFAPLHNYIGTEDIFNKQMNMTKGAVADALATAAVFVMGEGSEQTPLAIIEDLTEVNFCARNPSIKELQELGVSMQDDLYAPLLMNVKWNKGNGKPIW